MAGGWQRHSVWNELSGRSNDSFGCRTHKQGRPRREESHEAVMVKVRMRQNHTNQAVIGGLHALDLRQQIGAWLRGIDRQTQIEQQSSAIVFQFNAGAADLLCTSVDADVHARDSMCSHSAHRDRTWPRFGGLPK